MLDAEQRRSKLEELLSRVKKNRGYLDEARAAEMTAEPEVLPSPTEPAPMNLDQDNATTADILGAGKPEVPFEDEAAYEIDSQPPPSLDEQRELGATDEEEELTLDLAEPSSHEPEGLGDDDEVYVPDVSDEIIDDETPAPPVQALTAARFESAPRATGEVAARTGEAVREWTLRAVLDRAWKLGE